MMKKGPVKTSSDEEVFQFSDEDEFSQPFTPNYTQSQSQSLPLPKMKSRLPEPEKEEEEEEEHEEEQDDTKKLEKLAQSFGSLKKSEEIDWEAEHIHSLPKTPKSRRNPVLN